MAVSGCDVIRSTQDTEENKFIYTDLFNQYSATWPKEKGRLVLPQFVPVGVDAFWTVISKTIILYNIIRERQ